MVFPMIRPISQFYTTVWVTKQGSQTLVRRLRQADGTCLQNEFTQMAAPVAAAGTITGFTPPFKVRFN
jgi:hypothetical protein